MANFTRTGQKGQQAALVCLHQMCNNVGHVPPQQGASPGVCSPANHLPRAQCGRYVSHLHRVYLALAEHRGAAAQKFGHRRHIQCGRHDNQPQIGAQRRLTFKAKGQTRIGYERTLVKFVKNNAGNIRQVGVFLQHAGQHAFGYNFHTGVAAHAAFVAHAVAHKPAGLFAKQGSHIARQCAGGHAPGFKQQNAAAFKPGLIHEPQRHSAAFACAGQGAEHEIAPLRQGRQNFRARNIKRARGYGQPASRGRCVIRTVDHGKRRLG